MQTALIDYSFGSRFLRVTKETVQCSTNLYISELGREFAVSKIEFLQSLGIDDILYINAFGTVKRVYESESRTVDFMMTIHCNSNCVMCPVSEGARQSNEDGYHEWLLDLIDILPNDIEHICITGGEPTLIADRLFVIIEKLTQKFPYAEYQVLTNGRSCANSDFCKRIVDALPGNTLFGIPLHAGNEDLYDSIAQVKGGFTQVVQGIKNLVKNRARVEVRVVVSKMNAASMDELARFILDNLRGIRFVTFMGIETMGNAVKNYDAIWIDYASATKAFESAIDLLIAGGTDVMIYNYPLCCIKEKYWLLARRSITEHKVRYYEQCDICLVKSACSGFFQSTFNVAKPKINPVVDV